MSPRKSPSSADPSAAVAQAVSLIEKEAARQAKAARETYASEVKVVRDEFKAKERALAAAEREELKRIERWRVGAVAALEGRPTSLNDVRSVRREHVITATNGVSLARPKIGSAP